MGFLDLQPEAQQLSPEQFSSDEMDAYVDERWYTEAMYQQSFNTDNIDKWKSELPPLHRFSASVVMAGALVESGYDVPPLHLTLHRFLKQVRSAWRQLKSRVA